MLKKIKYKNVVWIDLQNPGEEETLQLATEYDLPTLSREELVSLNSRSVAECRDHGFFLSLPFPTGRSGETKINFVIGCDFLITAHHQPVQPLLEFAQILDGGDYGRKKEEDFQVGHLFYYMIRKLYGPTETALEDLNEELKQAEATIGAGDEAAAIKPLAAIGQRLTAIGWSLKFHPEILRSLVGDDFGGETFRRQARAVVSQAEHLTELWHRHRATLKELRSTNQSLLLLKQVQATRHLTILGIIFLPLSLIGLVFSMSGAEAVIRDGRGWVGVLLLMIVAAIVAVTLTKRQKWI